MIDTTSPKVDQFSLNEVRIFWYLMTVRVRTIVIVIVIVIVITNTIDIMLVAIVFGLSQTGYRSVDTDDYMPGMDVFR